MNYRTYAQSYKTVSVETASPGKLVLMLFDGALRFISVASHGFGKEDVRERYEVVNNNLIKAQNILTELQNALDLNTEGDFATTMYRLYDYMHGQLQEANIRKCHDPLKVVEKLLREIRDAWEEMLQNGGGQPAGAAPVTSLSQSA